MSRIIIDVREPIEFKMSHAKGAINIPPSRLIAGSDELNGISKDTEIILYCRTGSRSAVSMDILQNMGYTKVVNGINKDHVEAKYL